MDRVNDKLGLARLPDVTVGVMNHPQSSLADVYRELGVGAGSNMLSFGRFQNADEIASALA